jgi:hypothetical protein
MYTYRRATPGIAQLQRIWRAGEIRGKIHDAVADRNAHSEVSAHPATGESGRFCPPSPLRGFGETAFA